MPLLLIGSGQDAAIAVLEDRFQPNMTVSDTCPTPPPPPRYGSIDGKCTRERGNAEEPWPSRGKAFSEVTTEWRLRGQWSEGEVLF